MLTIEELLHAVDEYQCRVRGVDHSQLTDTERMQYLRHYALALIVEQTELLNTTPWKPWRYTSAFNPDKEESLNEWTDILIFLLDQALCLGFTAAELDSAIRRTLVKIQLREDIKSTEDK